MLEKINPFKKKEEGVKQKLFHVAITMNCNKKWLKNKRQEFLAKIDQEELKDKLKQFNKEHYVKRLRILKEIAHEQVNQDIPIISFYVLPSNFEYQDSMIDELIVFFQNLVDDQHIHDNQVKISVLGKWYDLPHELTTSIKNIINATKDYDKYFLNLCINYDGQEEIIDACKMIARQVKNDKIDVDAISKDMVKENIYSSYFLPPNLIIKNGLPRNSDLLLWDSHKSKIIFTKKEWPEFTKQDFLNIISHFK
ncbi:polyprenyl diphosphate synthase [Nanoarchaeota archaeon]